MLGLVNNLKNKYDMQVQDLHCNNVGENMAFKKAANRKGWGWTSNTVPQECHKMAASNKYFLPLQPGMHNVKQQKIQYFSL